MIPHGIIISGLVNPKYLTVGTGVIIGVGVGVGGFGAGVTPPFHK